MPEEAEPTGTLDGNTPSPVPPSGPRRMPRAIAATARRRPLLAGFVAGILGAAVIAAAVLVAIRPSTQPLRYTGMPAPCLMITEASLAKYLPGATSSQQGLSLTSTLHGGACTWSSTGSRENQVLFAQVRVYGSSNGLSTAQNSYREGIPASCECRGYTVATQAVTGLGDEATAVFTAYDQGVPSGNAPADALFVRSGNADIILNYIVTPVVSAPPPAHSTLLTVMTAMARDILAALANPSAVRPAATASAPVASPSPSGPRYAAPHDWCRLVKASTLTRYAPGAANNPVPNPSPSGPVTFGTCTWAATNTSIVLNVRLHPDPQSAQQAFQIDISIRQRTGNGIAYNGMKLVTGIGRQAVAIYQTYQDVPGGSQAAELLVWSGNAEIDVSISGISVVEAPPSRSEMLAAEKAMARDVLADLPSQRT